MRRRNTVERSDEQARLVDQLEKWTALRDSPEWMNFRKQLSQLMARIALRVVDHVNEEKIDAAKKEAAIYDSYARLLGLANRRAYRLEATLFEIQERYHVDNGKE